MLDAGVPQVTGGGRVGIRWELPAGRSGRRCLAAICHFEVKLCLLERGFLCYVDDHGLMVVEAQAEGLEDVGKAVGAVCLMDVRVWFIFLYLAWKW